MEKQLGAESGEEWKVRPGKLRRAEAGEVKENQQGAVRGLLDWPVSLDPLDPRILEPFFAI